MKYQGSKNKIAKQLLSAIPLEGFDNWIEPFVGGCGMIRNVPDSINKIGADNNKYIIHLWNKVQRGWQPPYITKEEYNHIKENPEEFAPELVAFTAVGCSFRGGWFNGYTDITNTKAGTVRDYVDESRRAVTKLSPLIKNIEFINCNYNDLTIPNNSIVYCDPPYADTKKYKDQFDHEKFWNWAEKLSVDGLDKTRNVKVYVSEYSAPENFTSILELKRTQTMSHQKKQVSTENLYTIKI